jgi:hypothetical protein
MRIPSDDGLLALAGAIVRSAAREAGGRVTVKHRGRPPSPETRRVQREAARRWFRDPQGLFAVICDVMGRPPAEMRRELGVG